jgi:hypothetical protein
MSVRLQELLGWLRREKGSLFLSRVALRVRSNLAKAALLNDEEAVPELRAACKSLGVDLPESASTNPSES